MAVAEARGIPVGDEALEGVAFDGTVEDPSVLVASAREAGLADSQVTVFEDGVVTYAEYEALFQEGLACARARGVELRELGTSTHAWTGVTFLNYGIPVEEEGPPPPEVDAAVAGCMTKHVEPAERIYERQQSLPQEEVERRRRRAWGRYHACLVERGVDLPPWEEMEYQDLLPYLDIIHSCEAPNYWRTD